MTKIPILWTCPKCSGHLFFWSQIAKNRRGSKVYPVCRTCDEIMFDANFAARDEARDKRHNKIMFKFLFPIMIVVFIVLAVLDTNIQ
jgi:hypothetical protein